MQVQGDNTASLVAYFSCSGMTRAVAEKLAEATGSEIFEIVPETPYTAADLDWKDSSSRTTKEKDDDSCRPKIKNGGAPVASADVVYIGFPIWWYKEPNIIDTFLESYDFSGKTVVPFATSGSSGMDGIGSRMQNLVPAAKVLGGRRFALPYPFRT
nr:flavodoxin [Candidatus Methanomethylophilus sp. 1R26]